MKRAQDMTAPARTGVSAYLGLASWLGVLASACGPPPATPHPQPETLFADLGGPVTIGPAPTELTGTRPADCEPCHAEIVAEWRSSMHARAWTDPIFQNEYRTQPHPSCRGCHAPGNPAGQVSVAGPGRDGISCAVCHVRAQTIVGASPRSSAGRAGHDHDASDRAHAVRLLPLLTTSEFCAPCHQFHFPATSPHDVESDSTGYDPSLWLQDTYNEWTRSRAAAQGRQCQDCHMPLATGASTHRSHRFAGMRSPTLLARSLHVQVTAQRMSDHILVRMRIRGADIGHALPTGDMFRQLVIRARVSEQTWTDAAQVTLKRWFAPVRHRTADGSIDYWHGERADTRVPPPGSGRERVVELTLPASPSPPRAQSGSGADRRAPVYWRIELWAREPGSSLLRGVSVDTARAVVRHGRVPVAVPFQADSRENRGDNRRDNP